MWVRIGPNGVGKSVNSTGRMRIVFWALLAYMRIADRDARTAVDLFKQQHFVPTKKSARHDL